MLLDELQYDSVDYTLEEICDALRKCLSPLRRLGKHMCDDDDDAESSTCFSESSNPIVVL